MVDEVVGDSVTRRMVAEYGRPAWQDWCRIVSAINFGADFRVQRRARFGGYGLLPAVAEGAPYQPLTSPPDEEATYQLTKRGGTEDITLEMIANDDIAAIRRIPIRLGRSAATTLYRFVFDLLATNTATTYDATALFHANHANTDNPAALGQSTLSAGRRTMRKQAAYADSSDALSIVPRYLIVPSDLEELAFQLCTSVVAVPATPAGPSDTPNLHRGMEPDHRRLLQRHQRLVPGRGDSNRIEPSGLSATRPILRTRVRNGSTRQRREFGMRVPISRTGSRPKSVDQPRISSTGRASAGRQWPPEAVS
ncbi:MAG: hypothetical protein ACRDRX_13285 [Pseudonocardiaceae bacterium]